MHSVNTHGSGIFHSHLSVDERTLYPHVLKATDVDTTIKLVWRGIERVDFDSAPNINFLIPATPCILLISRGVENYIHNNQFICVFFPPDAKH